MLINNLWVRMYQNFIEIGSPMLAHGTAFQHTVLFYSAFILTLVRASVISKTLLQTLIRFHCFILDKLEFTFSNVKIIVQSRCHSLPIKGPNLLAGTKLIA